MYVGVGGVFVCVVCESVGVCVCVSPLLFFTNQTTDFLAAPVGNIFSSKITFFPTGFLGG